MSKNNFPIPADFHPVGYSDLVREFIRDAPKKVNGVDNLSNIYYRDWMLRKLFAIFDFSGIPEAWDYDYMMENLFLDGKFCITDTELGVLPLSCGVSGVNVFNHPSEVQIGNPVLGSLRRTIDKDCALVKLQYNYLGIRPMIERYATLLSMCDSAIAVNLMNSKVAFIARTGSKAQAATYKRMFDIISSGEPFVAVNADAVNEDDIFYNHVKQNFVADEIQIVKRKIINEFLTEVGINNANLDKRERLNADEVAANDDETRVNVQHWLDNIRAGLASANRLYGLNLSVKMRDYLIDNGRGAAAEGGIDESSESD